jgi:hypothetical protein
MKPEKPSKPYKGFPLFLHQSGQWAKKVRGKIHYFGTDAVAAEAKWHKERDDLYAGCGSRSGPWRTVPATPSLLTW